MTLDQKRGFSQNIAQAALRVAHLAAALCCCQLFRHAACCAGSAAMPRERAMTLLRLAEGRIKAWPKGTREVTRECQRLPVNDARDNQRNAGSCAAPRTTHWPVRCAPMTPGPKTPSPGNGTWPPAAASPCCVPTVPLCEPPTMKYLQ